jgi:hypothetical protein
MVQNSLHRGDIDDFYATTVNKEAELNDEKDKKEAVHLLSLLETIL